MKNKTKIVAVGEMLWDIFPERKCLGGAPLNFVYHCKNFGLDAQVVSAVGEDRLGQELLGEVENLGVKIDYIQKSDFSTGTVQVSLGADGQPSYEITEKVAWDNVLFNKQLEKLAGDTEIFYFGSLACRNAVSKNAIFQFAKHLPKGALRICDINLRQEYYSKELVMELLQLADVLKINDEELEVVRKFFNAEQSEEAALLDRLLDDFNLKLVILTRGAKGSLLFSRSEKDEYQAAPVLAKDTVGAGDSFTAAVCYGLLHDWPFEQINEAANKLAGFVCKEAGATPKVGDVWSVIA